MMSGKYSWLTIVIVPIILVKLNEAKLIENETVLRSYRPFEKTTHLVSSEFSLPHDTQSIFNTFTVDRANKTSTIVSAMTKKLSQRQPKVLKIKGADEVPISYAVKVSPTLPVSKQNHSIANLIYNTSQQDLSKVATTQAQILEMSSRSSTKMQRIIDLIGHTIKPVQTKTTKSQIFDHDKDPMSDDTLKMSRSSLDYINYRKAYGIRYDPNKVRRSFNFHTVNNSEVETTSEHVEGASNEVDVVLNNSQVEQIDSTVPTDGEPVTSTELSEDSNTTEAETVQSSGALEQYTKFFPTVDTPNESIVTTTIATPMQFNNTNIMTPSHVQSTIQLIKSRVKHLFTYGLEANEAAKNGQRFLNIFNVIKFQNVPCSSQKAPLTSMNGTCYNQDECDQLGGVVVDVCAGGFGVCCVCE